MTRIVFYSNLVDKQLTLANLVQQVLDKRRKVTILAESEQAASQVSQALWQAGTGSFLPNVLATHALASFTPVLVDWQEEAGQEKVLFQDDILINLTQLQLTVFSRYRQFIELVSCDETDKVSARQRYKFYRDRGYEIQHIDYANV